MEEVAHLEHTEEWESNIYNRKYYGMYFINSPN